jgi:opacity protein-like surface antigen
MKPSILMFVGVALLPLPAMAQAPDPATVEPRYVVMAGTGFGTTWDDEGLLGRGGGVSGAAGVRVGRRLTILGLVDRVSYYRDVEWLTFDGRVVFAGAEMSLQFGTGRVNPYVTFGGGAMNDSGVWIRKAQGPSPSRIDERIDRDGTRAAMTGSGGVEIEVTPRISLRGGLRIYGLLDTGDDLFPHTVVQPTVAAVFRF